MSLEGRVEDDEVNAGSWSRWTRRSAYSYQRDGVELGSRWPWKVLSWFACDGRREARRDTRFASGRLVWDATVLLADGEC